MKKLLILIFAFLFFIPFLNSAVYYVSPAGLDSHPGTQSSPWQTIQYAVDSIKKGDTVLINDGTYVENISIGDLE
ncbi:MAG: hypothetical protein A2252_11805 [Elusimicrobia bacterium RIFOXYA2_FULL_39_19]|nr:MAG: hypothetical protein A2252_11805 [Elusimicrobia bacterium RIFOXYA2_FULL_39_19]